METWKIMISHNYSPHSLFIQLLCAWLTVKILTPQLSWWGHLLTLLCSLWVLAFAHHPQSGLNFPGAWVFAAWKCVFRVIEKGPTSPFPIPSLYLNAKFWYSILRAHTFFMPFLTFSVKMKISQGGMLWGNYNSMQSLTYWIWRRGR